MTTTVPTPTTTAPASAPDSSGALFGHAAHVVCLLLGLPFLAWVPALCLRNTAKDAHQRAHATTALDFALTQLIVWSVWGLLLLGSLVMAASNGAVVAPVVIGAAGLVYFALGVRATCHALFHAYRIEPYRYPAYVAFRMVR
ncbi:DUF4870 domain-containing protein [Streptomyces sp. NPDC050418]|uniref:DUF4870 domain-containing protein n=1 Tax=Streptomyces sp. NPDC050418 TaxID=3365612 RepID=UPI00378AF000